MWSSIFLAGVLTALVDAHVARTANKPCEIPSGHNTVKLSIIHPGGFRNNNGSAFLTPTINGTAFSDMPSFSAFIEHRSRSGKTTKLLFDLGLRQDWENLPPAAAAASRSSGNIKYSYGDPAVQLEKAGISPASIDHVIFSHSHFDHIGNMDLFPKTTGLIVGPGFQAALLPGYPINPRSFIYQSDFDNRTVREINFSNSNLRIAGLPALDFFGDGSVYLLSAPGHAVGHLALLARTTRDPRGRHPDTFILMAADSTHHAGALRPTSTRPLPRNIPRRDHLLEIHPEHSPIEPFYRPSSGGVNLNATLMSATLDKIEGLDGRDDVLTVLAHDRWLLDVVDLFPRAANEWRRKGWGERTRWRFVNDFA